MPALENLDAPEGPEWNRSPIFYPTRHALANGMIASRTSWGVRLESGWEISYKSGDRYVVWFSHGVCRTEVHHVAASAHPRTARRSPAHRTHSDGVGPRGYSVD